MLTLETKYSHYCIILAWLIVNNMKFFFEVGVKLTRKSVSVISYNVGKTSMAYITRIHLSNVKRDLLPQTLE